MGIQTWQETVIVATGDGTAKTATTAGTVLPTQALYTLPPNFFYPGKAVRIRAMGRISCVVTTPGTFRLDLRLGGTVVFDSGALNLNVVAKTNVPWWFEAYLTCRTAGSGTAATLMGQGLFESEAVVGSPLPSAGSNGSLLCPVGAPAVGGGFDSTASKQIDLFHTQTAATGSVTLHQFLVEALN